jgi:hypothetical protein
MCYQLNIFDEEDTYCFMNIYPLKEHKNYENNKNKSSNINIIL